MLHTIHIYIYIYLHILDIVHSVLDTVLVVCTAYVLHIV